MIKNLTESRRAHMQVACLGWSVCSISQKSKLPDKYGSRGPTQRMTSKGMYAHKQNKRSSTYFNNGLIQSLHGRLYYMHLIKHAYDCVRVSRWCCAFDIWANSDWWSWLWRPAITQHAYRWVQEEPSVLDEHDILIEHNGRHSRADLLLTAAQCSRTCLLRFSVL